MGKSNEARIHFGLRAFPHCALNNWAIHARYAPAKARKWGGGIPNIVKSHKIGHFESAGIVGNLASRKHHYLRSSHDQRCAVYKKYTPRSLWGFSTDEINISKWRVKPPKSHTPKIHTPIGQIPHLVLYTGAAATGRRVSAILRNSQDTRGPEISDLYASISPKLRPRK